MRLRFDVVLALSALVISTLACVSSILQTRVIGQQLSAGVWPYLSFSTSSTNHRNPREGQDSFAVLLANDGLGPAIVRSFGLTVDGRRMTNVDRLIEAVAGGPEATLPGETTSTSLDAGSVLRTGADVTLLEVRGKKLVVPFRQHVGRADIAICYCSILENCWLVHFRGRTHEPSTCRT